MKGSLITERVTEIAAEVTRSMEIELVQVEVAGTKRDGVLRIYIDKPGGVTLDDCGKVSQQIETVLDAEDLIPSRYVLEVSSPGIERQLYSLGDFVKFKGELAKVKTKIATDGQNTFIGTIESVSGEEITIDDRTRGRVTIDYPNVAKANLKIDLSREFGRK